MAQTDAQRLIAARRLAMEMFNPRLVASLNLDDLKAAIGSIDDTMDLLPATLTAVQTVKQNLVQRLPEPFKTNATAAQKAVALSIWALKEANAI